MADTTAVAEKDVMETVAVDAEPTAKSRLLYSILDVPPWWECSLLGFQHYLTMLGSTVLIPFLLVPAMGGTDAGERSCRSKTTAATRSPARAAINALPAQTHA
jgi:hypothetical protein